MTTRPVRLFCIAVTLAAPASAQVDIAGEWGVKYMEDGPERAGALGPRTWGDLTRGARSPERGPSYGEYTGLPLNEAGRRRAESWDTALTTLPEYQCQPHTAAYMFRGPAPLRISKIIDPASERFLGYEIYGGFGRATRRIWMDGRARPAFNAAHTWAGFSTGAWAGNVLKVVTTHLKEGSLKRNGVTHSDAALMTEYFVRHGDVLTITMFVEDPIYLSEPFVKSVDFGWNPTQTVGPETCTPFDVTIEVPGRGRQYVPHFLPGASPPSNFNTKYGVLVDALGGEAASLYPDYLATIGARQPAPRTPLSSVPFGVAPPIPSDVSSLHVQGTVWMISVGAFNAAASIGDDGVLLVDTMPENLVPRLLSEVERLAPGKPIRYLILTGDDPDHRGGSAAVMARAEERREPVPALVAHENAARRLAADASTPRRAVPTDTFFNAVKELRFNGEAIQILHQPSARADGDVIVHFRRSDVIVTGDVFNFSVFPEIRGDQGGTLQGMLDGIHRVLDLAVPGDRAEGGTYIIPGHGRLSDESDLASYRDMLSIVRDRIDADVRSGRTLMQIKAARPALDYEGRYAAAAGASSTDAFVEAIYAAVAPRPTPAPVPARRGR